MMLTVNTILTDMYIFTFHFLYSHNTIRFFAGRTFLTQESQYSAVLSNVQVCVNIITSTN